MDFKKSLSFCFKYCMARMGQTGKKVNLLILSSTLHSASQIIQASNFHLNAIKQISKFFFQHCHF